MLNSSRSLAAAVRQAGHSDGRRWPGARRVAEPVALAFAAVLLLNALAAAPALAQDSQPAAAANEKVIITPPPQQGSRLRAALSRLLGKDQREALSKTKSEV